MRTFKFFYTALFLLIVSAGCKKEVNDDLSLLETAAAPTNLSVLFNITQDNTGLVTITPNGEGGVIYDIYFGDATTTPAKVLAGGNATHTYAEGVYNVKVVSHNVAGKTSAITDRKSVV